MLLIGMAVAAVWMGSLLPAWRQQAQREREIETIFRGEQYARAIALYRRAHNGLLPTNIDDLVSQHYLRHKWKDLVSNDDFVLVPGQNGGIQGVQLKSTATSIRVYYNQQQYNLWPFSYQYAEQKMGIAPGRGGAGGRQGGADGRGRGGIGDGRGGGTGDGRGGGAGGDGRGGRAGGDGRGRGGGGGTPPGPGGVRPPGGRGGGGGGSLPNVY